MYLSGTFGGLTSCNCQAKFAVNILDTVGVFYSIP